MGTATLEKKEKGEGFKIQSNPLTIPLNQILISPSSSLFASTLSPILNN